MFFEGLSLDMPAAGTGDMSGQILGTILPSDKSPQGQVQGTSLPVQCPECGQVLSQARNLKRHYQVCHQATLFPCDLCSCSYNRYDNLQKHIRDKHGIGVKLACPTCRRSFRSRAALEKHATECYSAEMIEWGLAWKFLNDSTLLTREKMQERWPVFLYWTVWKEVVKMSTPVLSAPPPTHTLDGIWLGGGGVYNGV